MYFCCPLDNMLNAMTECLHSKFLFNNAVKSCKDFDEKFLYHGMSPYEVIKIINGIPLFLEDHIKRFRNTLKLIDRELNMDDIQLKESIFKLEEINGIKEGNIKMFFNYFKSEVTCIIYFLKYYYPSADQYTKGVAVGLFQSKRDNPNVKLINKSLITSAGEEKSSKGVYEVILINDNGSITEGSKSNIFFIKENTIYTSHSSSVLPGITRKYVISSCRRLGIPIIEKEIHLTELEDYNSVFITSTSNNVLPVSSIGDLLYDPDNELLRSVMKEFNKLVDNYIMNFR